MKRSNRLILLIGFLLAAVAFVGIIVLQQPTPDPGTGPQASPSLLPTVYARTDIPLGARITAAMLEQKDTPVAERSTTAFESTTLLLGKIARNDIPKGAQLTDEDINGGRTGVTSVTVPAGLVAIAIQVDQVTGVGTLINRGDYVDMVVGVSTGQERFPILDSTTNTKVADDWYDHTSTKILLQGMLVVGTLLPPPPSQPEGEGAVTGDPGAVLNGQQELVIVAVTPQQAEVIKFAQLDGSITLVLRSPDDFIDANGNRIVPAEAETTGIVLKTLIDQYGVLTPILVQTTLPDTIPAP